MSVRILALGALAAALSAGAATAADLIIPTTPEPIMASAGFDWSGLYAGVRAGAGSYNGVGYGQVGGAVGVNFIPTDPILLGLEVTGDYYWDNATNGGIFFFNLKGGVVVTDNALLYAIGGIGQDYSGGVTTGMYQLGGGAEFAVTDAVTVRAEVVGQGDFDGAADPFFEGVQATVGVFYHF